jgi:hypothetical protein
MPSCDFRKNCDPETNRDLASLSRVFGVKVVKNTGLKCCSTRKQALQHQYATPVFLYSLVKKQKKMVLPRKPSTRAKLTAARSAPRGAIGLGDPSLRRAQVSHEEQ